MNNQILTLEAFSGTLRLKVISQEEALNFLVWLFSSKAEIVISEKANPRYCKITVSVELFHEEASKLNAIIDRLFSIDQTIYPQSAFSKPGYMIYGYSFWLHSYPRP